MSHMPSHRISLILAIGLHAILFLALFLRFVSSPTRNLEWQPDVNIIKAVAIYPAEIAAPKTQLAVEKQKKQREVLEKEQKAQEALQQQKEAKALAIQHQKEAEAAVQKKAAQQEAQKQALKKAEAAALLAQQKAEQKLLEQQQIQQAAAVQKKQAQKAAEEKATQQKQAAQKKQEEKATEALKLAQQKALEHQMAAEQKQLEAARTNQQQTEIEKFTALILHTMRQNWIVPEAVDPKLSCQLSIRLSPEGKVLSVALLRSSGNAALDNSARLAVFKSSPLPVPADLTLFNEFFKEFNLTLSPKDIT